MSTHDSNNSGDSGGLGDDLSVGIVPNKSEIYKNTGARKQAFLVAYAKSGTVTQASKSIGISPATPYDWLKHDNDGFKANFEQAKQSFADSLESIAFERVQTRDTNDVLLITLLNAHKPDKYRPNAQATNEQASEVIAKLTRLTRKSAGGREEIVEIAEVRG
jgi:hypothetical protein